MENKIGEFYIKDIDLYSYSSEKSLQNLLLNHIESFMLGVFNEKVKSATDKKSERIGYIKLRSGQLLPKRGARVDLWVECESGEKYLIEIKNEKLTNYGNFKAIGQMLGYSVMFPEATKLVIVSTTYDEGVDILLTKHNLPIDFVLVTRDRFFLLKKYGKG